jgi:hypothetical protein
MIGWSTRVERRKTSAGSTCGGLTVHYDGGGVRRASNVLSGPSAGDDEPPAAAQPGTGAALDKCETHTHEVTACDASSR